MEVFIFIISLSFATAFYSHLPSCNLSVTSCAAAVLHPSALKVPGLKLVTGYKQGGS